VSFGGTRETVAFADTDVRDQEETVTTRRLATVLGAAVIGAAALVPLACGDDGGGSGSSTPELTPQQERNPRLVTGREVYIENCASCHGAAGDGGSGPKLSDGEVEDNLTLEEQIEVIADGRGNMPPWGDDLSEEEIEGVAQFEREVL
jgi:mono/diheme cytochrome c family protein